MLKEKWNNFKNSVSERAMIAVQGLKIIGKNLLKNSLLLKGVSSISLLSGVCMLGICVVKKASVSESAMATLTVAIAPFISTGIALGLIIVGHSFINPKKVKKITHNLS